MKNIKSVIRIIEHVQFILTKKQKKESVGVFVSMIVSSLLELLGVSIIYPFLQFMLDETAMENNKYILICKKLWPFVTNSQLIVALGMMIALVYVIKNSVALLCVYIQTRYSARINRELSVRMLNSYMKRPYIFFLNTNSSIIMRGLAGDVNSVYSILLNSFQILAESFSILFIAGFLISVDPGIAIASVFIAFASFMAITLGFKGIMKKLGKQLRELQAYSSGFTYQAIHGIKEITVLDRRQRFVEQYDTISRKIEKKTISTNLVNAFPDRALEATCIVGVMGVLCFRISTGIEMESFIPALGAFVMGVFRIMPSVSRVSNRVNNIVYYMPGLNNTYEILKDNEIIDRQKRIEEEELSKQLAIEKITDIKFHDSLVIDNIFWKYGEKQDYVLKGLSLTIHRGESVALIGTSGGGKSTLVDIIMTLFKPQKGTIKADGIDIFLMQSKWHKLIGYVPQAVFLINDTVRSNVAFGLPDEDVSDEKVWDALEKAQLKSFVSSLPDGLNTIVGEWGVKFSGGQKQRIAIARALYDDPEILILDEATAALDNETERAFMEAVELLQGEKTIILVAHRLTTIKNCDRVYEIQNGIATEKDIVEVLGNQT